MNALAFYRVARWAYVHHIPVLPRIMHWLVFLTYNCVIPWTCDIGPGTRLGYGGMGVVIHSRARIGANCAIAQQVTVGGRSGSPGVPVIGDNVVIGAGAKVLGNITIGNGSVIGANAVVIHDVPPRCVAAGVPARIIKRDVSSADYA